MGSQIVLSLISICKNTRFVLLVHLTNFSRVLEFLIIHDTEFPCGYAANDACDLVSGGFSVSSGMKISAHLLNEEES